MGRGCKPPGSHRSRRWRGWYGGLQPNRPATQPLHPACSRAQLQHDRPVLHHALCTHLRRLPARRCGCVQRPAAAARQAAEAGVGAASSRRRACRPHVSAEWTSDLQALCKAMPFMVGCSMWTQCTVGGQGRAARRGQTGWGSPVRCRVKSLSTPTLLRCRCANPTATCRTARLRLRPRTAHCPRWSPTSAALMTWARCGGWAGQTGKLSSAALHARWLPGRCSPQVPPDAARPPPPAARR